MNASVVVAAGERHKIVGLICTGHYYSHFSNLVLPPLFPLLKAETGVDYVALGALVAAPAVASGASQVPIGFLVDRFGGRPVLLAGIVVMGVSFALVGVATEFWQLLILMTLVGLGNGVFHPADYAILTQRIDDGHLGRAVSLHGFSGYIGWATAPVVMLALSEFIGWRMAVSTIGIAGLAIVVALMLFGARLNAPATRIRSDESAEPKFSPRQGLELMMSLPMVMLLAFFLLTAITTGGMASFLVVASIEIYGVGEALANSVLTGYLVAMAAGVLAGGVVADKVGRHNFVASYAVLGFAAMIVLFAIGALPFAIAAIATAFGGFMFGVATPSRDLLVREIAPPGTIGVAFGFTSTGLGIGGALGPVASGWFMDAGAPGWAFVMLAGMSVLAVPAIMLTRARALSA